MKAFLRGFVKGLAGCLAVVALGLLFCHVTGLLDWVRPGENTAKEADVRLEEEQETSDREADGAGGQSASVSYEEEAPDARTEQETNGEAVISLGEEEGQTEEEGICLLFAGDLYLTDVLQSKYQKNGISAAATEGLLTRLHQADLFILNQEFPFGTTGEAAVDKEYTFRVHPDFVKVEQELGVDLVTLANNHMLDFGRGPLTETLNALDNAGIAHVGAGENLKEASALKTFTVKGKTIGFLGASRVIPEASWNASAQASGLFTTYDASKLVEKIKEARESCDYVVVYVHWGIERNTTPEDYQKSLARTYIDAGADAVIGSHPHVLQGVEYYQGKPIFYSLGNFIFSNRPYESVLAELTLAGDEVQVKLIPLWSEQNQMGLMTDTAAFYENMRNLSFGVQIDSDGVVTP